MDDDALSIEGGTPHQWTIWDAEHNIERTVTVRLDAEYRTAFWKHTLAKRMLIVGGAVHAPDGDGGEKGFLA